jgi:hypothetical protein
MPPPPPVARAAFATGRAALTRSPDPAPPVSPPPQGTAAWPDFPAPEADNPAASGGSRRRLTLAAAAIVLVAALSAAGVVLAQNAHGNNNAGSAGNGASASGGASATRSATPSGPPTNPPQTTAAPAPVTYPNSASAYATAAVTAWSTGDTVRLGQLNDPGDSVFDTLDAGNYNKQFSVYQCSNGDPASICVLYNKVGDELDLHVRNVLVGHAHALVDGEWNPITFPTDLQAYAQEALNDWGKHNTVAVALLTGQPNDSAFGSVPDSHRGDKWDFNGTQGAAGHVIYQWKGATGGIISIEFNDPGFVTPPANRHGLIQGVMFQP